MNGPNKSPVFPQDGLIGFATLATANTALDGTGTVATLVDTAAVSIANSAMAYAAGYLLVTCAAHGKPIGSVHDVVLSGITCTGINPGTRAILQAKIASATQYVVYLDSDPGTLSVYGNSNFVPEQVRVDTVKCRALGSNVQTVLRLFVNNGSSSATATNNTLLHEHKLDAVTLDQTTESKDHEISLNVVLPRGYKLLATIGTTVAAGWAITALQGRY